MTVLHELIHFNFHDVPLAEAVRQMGKGPSRSAFSIHDTGKWKEETSAASDYWHTALKTHCDPNYGTQ